MKNEMYQPYEERLKHKADFRVRYCYYEEHEGARKSLPFQGLRSDFWYEHDLKSPTMAFMIWPEFEDENGNLIMTTDTPVNRCGTARMWVMVPEGRIYHREKIHLGMKCFFMEGRKVAECEVIEILDLPINPIYS